MIRLRATDVPAVYPFLRTRSSIELSTSGARSIWRRRERFRRSRLRQRRVELFGANRARGSVWFALILPQILSSGENRADIVLRMVFREHWHKIGRKSEKKLGNMFNWHCSHSVKNIVLCFIYYTLGKNEHFLVMELKNYGIHGKRFRRYC